MLALTKIRSRSPVDRVFLIIIIEDSSKVIDRSSGHHHLLEASLTGTVCNVVILEKSNIIEDVTFIKRMTGIAIDNTWRRRGELARIGLDGMYCSSVLCGNILIIGSGIRRNIRQNIKRLTIGELHMDGVHRGRSLAAKMGRLGRKSASRRQQRRLGWKRNTTVVKKAGQYLGC